MILSYISLFLMAYALLRFVFPLTCGPFAKLLLARDILLLLLRLAHCLGIRWKLSLSPDMQRLGLVFVAFALSGFGVWQSIRVPAVHAVELVIPGLPQQLEGFSLVQLSDLHIGPLLKGAWLQAVVSRTNALNPDVIVLTGDMIDGWPEALEREVQPLGELVARHGVYGVTGNHEYYYGARAWSSVFEKLGVDMLYNEHRVISAGEADLVLVGVPDPREERFDELPPDLENALEGSPDTVRILLAHQPGTAPDSQGVDIQLSGHTHGGVMFFLKQAVASFNNGFVQGLYKLYDKILYVSPGTGLWNGFSCRIGVPAELHSSFSTPDKFTAYFLSYEDKDYYVEIGAACLMPRRFILENGRTYFAITAAAELNACLYEPLLRLFLLHITTFRH